MDAISTLANQLIHISFELNMISCIYILGGSCSQSLWTYSHQRIYILITQVGALNLILLLMKNRTCQVRNLVIRIQF